MLVKLMEDWNNDENNRDKATLAFNNIVQTKDLMVENMRELI